VSDLGTVRRSQIRQLAETYARELPVRSVAVVGNKPLTPSAERAAAIDDCDLVVRVNGFRLDDDGEPATYGRRADVVFFTRGVRATPWFFSGYRDRLYLMVEPGRLHWEPDLIPSWWPQDLGQIHVNNDDLTVPLSAEMGLDSLRDSAWATTGTMAAWWARTTFLDAQMDIAGYSFVDEPAQTAWAHAYGEDCDVSADHHIALEAELMRRWITEGKATLWN
jgi:hypothetical protein